MGKEARVIPSYDELAAKCFKPAVAIVSISQDGLPSGHSALADGHMEFDCWVAEFTRALSRITIWLVGVTGLLGVATFLAAMAAKAAADHILTVERAYIYGGVHPGGRSAIREGGKIVSIRVKFSVANYGKTPGFIKTIKVGTAKLKGLSDDPAYGPDIPVFDLYFPMMTMADLRYPDDAEVVVPADGEHVVFQRIFYNDIFDNPHSSGSLHRIYIQRGKIKDRTISNKPKYWKMD